MHHSKAVKILSLPAASRDSSHKYKCSLWARKPAPHYTSEVNGLVAHDQLFHSVDAACAGTLLLTGGLLLLRQAAGQSAQSISPSARICLLQISLKELIRLTAAFSRDSVLWKREKKPRSLFWIGAMEGLILDMSPLLQGLGLVRCCLCVSF